MALQKEEISEKEKSFIIETICKHFPNVVILAFGSRINGGAKKYSNFDVAIDNKKPISFSKLALLEDDLSESDLPYKVDQIDFQKVSPEFQDLIRKKSIIWE